MKETISVTQLSALHQLLDLNDTPDVFLRDLLVEHPTESSLNPIVTSVNIIKSWLDDRYTERWLSLLDAVSAYYRGADIDDKFTIEQQSAFSSDDLKFRIWDKENQMYATSKPVFIQEIALNMQFVMSNIANFVFEQVVGKFRDELLYINDKVVFTNDSNALLGVIKRVGYDLKFVADNGNEYDFDIKLITQRLGFIHN